MALLGCRSRTGPRLVLFTIAILSGCVGYVPGEKAAWDTRVSELCAKDGGVRIFEKMRFTPEELRRVVRKNGVISVPDERLAAPEYPVYGVMRKDSIRTGSPAVTRTEVTIVRRKDKKVMGSWIGYRRTGGDFPSHAFPSTFECPDLETIKSQIQSIFQIEETPK